MVIKFTHSGGDVKVEDGGGGILHVVFQELHYNIWLNLWAVDRNGYMHSACVVIHFQLLSHSCNVERLPHPRSS